MPRKCLDTYGLFNNVTKSSSRQNGDGSANRWRFQDAKAKLSEVVRRARQSGPQRVTVHGRDIVAAFTSSPLADVDFDRLSVKTPVRDIDL
jgi:hypothetical protein